VREINLLRWHQSSHQLDQKKQRGLYVISAVIFLMFIMTHVGLTKLINQSSNEEQDLKNKLAVGGGSQQDNGVLEQLQVSQRKLWEMLNILNCFSQNQNSDKIQVTQIISQEKQINITGLVDSTATLRKAVAFCLNKDSLVSSMIFNHKNKTDFLQYSLVII